jgi:hypothetical protein
MVRVQFLAGAKDFSLLHSDQTSSENCPGPYLRGSVWGEGHFLRGKGGGAGNEADCSLSSRAKVKNGRAIPPLSLCSHGMVLT